jgi:hypothetical protein
MEGAERQERLAAHQPDRREPGRDGRPRRAGQALVDLVLEEIGRLVEQVEFDEAVCEAPDDLVPAPTDGRQLLEVEVERQGLDAGELAAFGAQQQLLQELARILLQRRVAGCFGNRPFARRAMANMSRQRCAWP